MTPGRVRICVHVALVLSLLSASRLHSQQPATQSDESQRYLKQLTKATENIEKSIQQLRSKGMHDVADSLANTQLVHYQRQLKLAKESVANGNVFGSAEYTAAIKAIAEHAKSDYQRAIQASQKRAELAISESYRQFDVTMDSINKTHREATSDSEETYRLKIASIDLKRKFRASSGRIGMVIWNLPIDKNLHQRMTTAVNLQLLDGSNVVWTRKNLKLKRKLPNNPIHLPNVMFDSVSVEIMKWDGSGGGLAEIQVILGDENVAQNRPCEVTSIETLPTHLDDQHALTDDVTLPTQVGQGYWIPEEGIKARVTINLLGKKVTSPVERDAITQ